MPTLNSLIRNRATVTIATENPDDPLIVTYQPAAVTPRLEALLGALRERDDVTRREQMDATCAYLTTVIHSWNLTEADGVTPLAVTPEAIAALDYEAQIILFIGITEDAYPGEVNARPPSAPSVSTSKPTAKQATSRHRSRTSTH